MRRTQDEPVLITSAHESSSQEFHRRQRKYAIMMTLRALCVIGAATTYHLSIILALVFVLAGVVLPWSAVLIANDGPAKKRATHPEFHRAPPLERALPAGKDHEVIDL